MDYAGWHRQRQLIDAMQQVRLPRAGVHSATMQEAAEGIIWATAAKMGEGWLLTAEMLELVDGGYGNIVCAQPFGCLPNHIVGKGMIRKIKRLTIPTPTSCPSTTTPAPPGVNQENRIKLMLAVAREKLDTPIAPIRPLTAEELAGGAPQVATTVQ